MEKSNQFETIESDGRVYEITSRDANGRINGLRRYNERVKIWVDISFSNDVDIEKVDDYNAKLLASQRNYLFK